MAREADSLIPVNAGIEVSVAATKSYMAQVISFYLLAIYMAEAKDSMLKQDLINLKHELVVLPQKNRKDFDAQGRHSILCKKVFRF